MMAISQAFFVLANTGVSTPQNGVWCRNLQSTADQKLNLCKGVQKADSDSKDTDVQTELWCVFFFIVVADVFFYAHWC